MPTVSVVICAYTDLRRDDLVRAVNSVRRQIVQSDRPQLKEIIVVIDHNPALLAWVRGEMPDVVALANNEQRGLSGARNTGLAAARGDIIAFLDDDAFAAPDWLERLAAAYADPRVIGVGGAIEPLWVGGRPAWFPSEFGWVVGCTYKGMPEVTGPQRNMIGANMSFRAGVFARTGDFRSGIGRVGTKPYGGEETELCIRALQNMPGSIILYEPAARVQHSVPPNRATWRYFISRCYAEGQSKALVSRLVGTGDGLASERSYTMRVLPRGVLSGLASAIMGRGASGLARAAAIIVGLGVTAAGYAMGLGSLPRGPRPAVNPQPRAPVEASR